MTKQEGLCGLVETHSIYISQTQRLLKWNKCPGSKYLVQNVNKDSFKAQIMHLVIIGVFLARNVPQNMSGILSFRRSETYFEEMDL